jgi:hypothetical protein
MSTLDLTLAPGSALGVASTAPPETQAAARAFEGVWPQWYVRYSVERAPFRMTSLPSRLRHAPTYLTSETFIDVRGVRADGTVLLDPEAYEALCWWDLLHPVVLFVHDEATGHWCLEPISTVAAWVAAGAVRPEAGPGGRTGWVIPAGLIFGDQAAPGQADIQLP